MCQHSQFFLIVDDVIRPFNFTSVTKKRLCQTTECIIKSYASWKVRTRSSLHSLSDSFPHIKHTSDLQLRKSFDCAAVKTPSPFLVLLARNSAKSLWIANFLQHCGESVMSRVWLVSQVLCANSSTGCDLHFLMAESVGILRGPCSPCKHMARRAAISGEFSFRS